MRYAPPFRDGELHVVAERCATCVFHPGNRMDLDDGRLASMVAGALAADSIIPCHKTLERDGAVCRGYFDAYGDRVSGIRVARGAGLIVEDPPRNDEATTRPDSVRQDVPRAPGGHP